jgi:hypothetical protein
MKILYQTELSRLVVGAEGIEPPDTPGYGRLSAITHYSRESCFLDLNQNRPRYECGALPIELKHVCKQHNGGYKYTLVAGVGFEPTALWL